jgi:hypothetical protein
VTRNNGQEPFHRDAVPLGFHLLDFWQWSTSDLLSNLTRGVLAEYIVARALGIDTTLAVRNEWDAFDLTTPTGVKVEVKSAAYLQSWHQERLSSVSFLTRRTRAWDPETNRLSEQGQRHADVYVFALLAHRDKLSVDPMNLKQWQFYVLPTRVLEQRTRSQHSITLKSLESLAGEHVDFKGLEIAVQHAAAAQKAKLTTDN